MTTQEIKAALEKDGLGAGLSLFEGPKDPALVVPREQLLKAARHLRDARHLAFDLLIMVTGTHMIEKRAAKGVVVREPGFELIYHVRSVKNRALVAFKVKLPIGDPTVDSVSSIWAAADWHERETFDPVGIRFTGHPETCAASSSLTTGRAIRCGRTTPTQGGRNKLGGRLHGSTCRPAGRRHDTLRAPKLPACHPARPRPPGHARRRAHAGAADQHGSEHFLDARRAARRDGSMARS